MAGTSIHAPGPGDLERLVHQAVRARSLVARHLGRALPFDESDLDVLQQLLDEEVLGAEDLYDLQCLGVVLGMRLADGIDGLDWAVVEDEHGRDPALRFHDSTLLIFPLTMISKRIEDGEEVDVRSLFERVAESIEQLRDRVVWPQ
jgi:hypothetical protein